MPLKISAQVYQNMSRRGSGQDFLQRFCYCPVLKLTISIVFPTRVATLIQFLRHNPGFCAFLLLFLVIRVFWSSYLPLMEFSEARYAEMSRKMLEYGDWITLWFTRDLPFWGKPPLSFWAVTSSFYLFGVNELASRLPSLIFTLGTAGLMLLWLRRELSSDIAKLATASYLSCWLVILSAGAVITDPALTLTTTLVMVGFWRGITHQEPLWIYLMWFALGLGLLTKGPIALVLCGIPCAAWVILTNQWRVFWQEVRLFRGLALMLAIAAPWYYLAEQKTPGFFSYFIVGEHFLRFTEPAWSGDQYGGVKDQPNGTIWLYLLVALLPFTPVVLFRLMTAKGRQALHNSLRLDKSFTIYLIAWFLAPAIFFTLAKNILITYVLTGLPAAAILIAKHCEDWLVPKRWFYPFVIAGLTVFLGVYIVAYEFYIKDHHYNQKPLIEAYQRLNETDPGPLVYWGAPRFSVTFYTKDTAIFPGPKVHEHYYPETHYHAVRDMWIESTRKPPFTDRCESVMHQSEYTLWYCPAVPKQ